MREKIPSEIVEVALNDATFAGTGAVLRGLTYINFLFGNNGAGKSTISRGIRSGAGVTYAPGMSAADYLVLLYDEDFIDHNFHSYHSMDGVFTINAVNLDVQRQLEEKEKAQATARDQRAAAAEEKAKKESARLALVKKFQQDCWDTAKERRVEFDKTQDQKRKSKQFTDAVLAATPEETDIEALRALYRSAYAETPQSFPVFSRIDDPSALDAIDGLALMETAIVNTSMTPFAQFVRKLSATQWVKEGHEKYAHDANGVCPYCQRALEPDFESILAESFDTQYEENIQALKAFLEQYRTAANQLFVPLQKLPEPLYSRIDPKPYNEKLASIRTTIQLNIERITKKIADPGSIITLDKIEPLLTQLNEIIDGYNQLIEENNAVVAAGPKKRKECVESVFSLIAFELKTKIAQYHQSDSDLADEIKRLDGIILAHDETLGKLDSEIRRLRASTVETDTAKDHINAMLRDNGIHGFRLEPHDSIPHVYKVVRPDGSLASNLSEGEKNFLAFLYFYCLVQGSSAAEGDSRRKIVIIDDPVSSMDSNSMFIVCALIRNMIEVCRNNADNRDPVAEGNYIKQMFILTHNAFFHREITYSYLPKYEYASFYLIRKRGNRSSVELKCCKDPKHPSQLINENPVKSSYAALWEEFRETQSPVPLINVIRQIVEYYFLQLCGYDGAELQRQVLTRGLHHEFDDAEGLEDDNQYDLAKSMLFYINASGTGFHDGLHFVEEAANPDVCREVLLKIFRIMKQEQHFKMMYRVED